MPEKHLALMAAKQVKKYGARTALRYREQGQWQDISWQEVGERIRATAKGLLVLGVPEGGMVGIFSQNCPEWTIADFGILSVRGVSVPIYATNTAKQAEYIVDEAEISVIFVGGADQYRKAAAVAGVSKYLKKIIVFDAAVPLADSGRDMYFRDFLTLGGKTDFDQELEARLKRADMNDLATLIYTSGTTGEPKGVMLHHSNFYFSFQAHNKRLTVSDQDVSMCFLPLSHVFERAWTYFALGTGMVVNYCDDTGKIVPYLQEVKPTIMCAVPRFYEKIYGAIFEKLEQAPPSKKNLFHWAVELGEKVFRRVKEKEPIPWDLKLKHRIAEKLVLEKLRNLVGGRIRFFPCAGAPLSKHIEEFFHSVGIPIKYGYGLTETTATVTCHEEYHYRPGTVGKPIYGVDVKIAPNGEILVRGETVMKGYYKKPEDTAAVFEGNWFKTGDVGVIEDGYLTITDRIKDLMKTSGGKYIAPQLIETTVGKDHFIEQISIIGDERKYVSALIVPAFEALEGYAQSRKISYTSREDLIGHPEIVQFYQERIEENQKELAGFEKIKKFKLLAKPFTQEDGEMTPTMKLKRKVINEKYRDLIDSMYGG
ncbi:MAG TPA: long-chain fatty acid--CoA ligase [Syntrophales bacterium]|jgi:long-chain acyl-CoA synthetase|nr:long-chain fatty acid--CoA ligase [Syntrophales bacterium]HON23691.1 long-chain fatty acid--CoA ligase [Syntrophales bacterium]HPC31522.1 long-chain fatty acid--CoA ligase [Syntrophales bacterium]HQG34739.1 long-chain fatty acid--CoA ligase [Syntrophales bacterium]HQI34825.1 long-chain fatty acid--CoA ligase [Syntrophales bacterium]